MTGAVPDAKRAPDTPEGVEVREEARRPVTDPTLGIAVSTERRGSPPHRLVAIGDSLTHGFQSGAIFNTDLSPAAIVAHELGWRDRFRYPRYNAFGGLPLNIELLLRDLEQRFGTSFDWWEVPSALFRVRQLMDEIEDYWERGPGSAFPEITGINHNLGVYGWDLRDALETTAEVCLRTLRRPRDDLIMQLVEQHGQRAALRVLPTTPEQRRTWTVFDAAARLGEDDGGVSEHGIETLLVLLGSNNALQAVTQLRVQWSGPGYDHLERKKPYTVWRPEHFAAELAHVAEAVRRIRARHVIWGTVPHVTIPPVARGVATKIAPGSRYFPAYTRPWISDRDFDPHRDPHLTSQQARAVDSAIDQYSDAIVDVVAAARREGRDWYVLEVAGLLDRLAARRYIDDPLARPDWWQPYALPAELAQLDPVPDSRFLLSDGRRRSSGGLFSLDGVHPTTVGYGILAQEIVNVMRIAGVPFHHGDGITVRPDPVTVDFTRLVRRDTLINRPPGNIRSGLGVIAWLDDTLDLFRRALSFGS